MIVIATELDPPHRWRKPGTHFAVQEILVDSSRPVQFRIEADDGSPAIIDAHHFEVADGSIPSTWSVEMRELSWAVTQGRGDAWTAPSL